MPYKQRNFIAMYKRIAFLLSVFLIMACDDSFSQLAKKYAIKLQSRSFVPPANGKQAFRKSSFSKTLFDHRFYMVIQFYDLPNEEEMKRLTSKGVHLYDYLPQFAYTVSLPEDIDSRIFASFPIRSLFYLNANDKMSIALKTGKFPEWAIKQTGTVELNVLLYESFNLSQIQSSFTPLQANIIHYTSIHKSIRVQIPQQHIFRLAQLPFVQWVEPIDPPVRPELRVQE